MRQTLDQLAKSILRVLLRATGRVETGLEIVGHALTADLWAEPTSDNGAEPSQLGLLGPMLARGPCLIEPFSQTPRPRDVRACICKQYSLDHARTRDARREKRQPPPFPGLWIISPGRSSTVIEKAQCHPMNGWPAGFWERTDWDAFQLIVIDSLPRTPETLPLRLLGRKDTLTEALCEFRELPETAWPKRLLVPVLVAFRSEKPQDHQEEEVMQTLQEIDAIYERWEQRTKDEGRRDVLLRQLAQRFGTLPDDVLQRIQDADTAHLQRWSERVIPARVLADVFE